MIENVKSIKNFRLFIYPSLILLVIFIFSFIFCRKFFVLNNLIYQNLHEQYGLELTTFNDLLNRVIFINYVSFNVLLFGIVLLTFLFVMISDFCDKHVNILYHKYANHFGFSKSLFYLKKHNKEKLKKEVKYVTLIFFTIISVVTIYFADFLKVNFYLLVNGFGYLIVVVFICFNCIYFFNCCFYKKRTGKMFKATIMYASYKIIGVIVFFIMLFYFLFPAYMFLSDYEYEFSKNFNQKERACYIDLMAESNFENVENVQKMKKVLLIQFDDILESLNFLDVRNHLDYNLDDYYSKMHFGSRFIPQLILIYISFWVIGPYYLHKKEEFIFDFINKLVAFIVAALFHFVSSTIFKWQHTYLASIPLLFIVYFMTTFLSKTVKK